MRATSRIRAKVPHRISKWRRQLGKGWRQLDEWRRQQLTKWRLRLNKLWRHRLKVWLRWLNNQLRKLDERQQKPTMHTEITDEKHVCVNCGTAFVGRFCPQCGLRANRHRMTAKNLVQGFLDIWGMGSQPMLRSIHELFWRPARLYDTRLPERSPANLLSSVQDADYHDAVLCHSLFSSRH